MRLLVQVLLSHSLHIVILTIIISLIIIMGEDIIMVGITVMGTTIIRVDASIMGTITTEDIVIIMEEDTEQ